MKYFFLLFFLFSSIYKADAQIEICPQQNRMGNITYNHDPRLDTLIMARIHENEREPVIYGFRVQIYFGTNREEALAARNKFQREFPEHDTYMGYEQPYFRIKVGDFRTRVEAQRLMQELKNLFPSTIIMSEQVNPEKIQRIRR
jgi:hypothetical protein